MSILDFLKGKKRKWDQVIEVSDNDFKRQVINRSYKGPVMVDFWADN
ncbi:MAG: thioredoxin-like negative regulator of GroEL [Cellvibrionaceae bacterium]|jgi:thioredoxin-like negative regulator of GroEL